MPHTPRLAILHTTPATIASLGALCARLLPGVAVNHYLDDSLLPQINREGRISPGVRYRFHSLIALAAASQPDVILSACSSVGAVLEEAQELFPIPLRRIDAPMAQAAAARPGSVVVCATLASTLGPTSELLRRYLPPERPVDTLLIAEAGPLLAAGDQAGYLSAIAARLGEAAAAHDTVVLAQASMAQAAASLPQAVRGKFLASPESGIAALRPLLLPGEEA